MGLWRRAGKFAAWEAESERLVRSSQRIDRAIRHAGRNG
jgi:hypothetical protein